MTVPIFRNGYSGADVAPPSANALRHALGGNGSDTQSARRDHSHADYVPKSLYSAKGDVLVASAATSPTVLAVGANNAFLQADSGAATGVKWNIDAWPSYTPTFTNLVEGNSQKTGFYMKIGRTVHFVVQFILGSTGTMGTNPTYTLPFAASSRYSSSIRDVIGQIGILDSGTANFVGTSFWISSTTGALQVHTAGGTYVSIASFTATVPMTWAANDAFFVWGTYEAAA